VEGAVSSDPVQAQLEAYNAHDAEAFASYYADPFESLDGRGERTLRTRREQTVAFAQFFLAEPAVHAEVPNRITVGQWVVEEEVVSGLSSADAHAILIYRVTDGLIASSQVLQ
jgi:hypothetical protein